MIENVRCTNTSDIDTYIQGEWTALEEPITRKAQMEEFMFLGLRMNEGVSRRDFENNFNIAIEAIYREPLEELKRKELLVARAGRIFFTDKGRDLSNYCLAKFLLDK